MTARRTRQGRNPMVWDPVAVLAAFNDGENPSPVAVVAAVADLKIQTPDVRTVGQWGYRASIPNCWMPTLLVALVERGVDIRRLARPGPAPADQPPYSRSA